MCSLLICVTINSIKNLNINNLYITNCDLDINVFFIFISICPCHWQKASESDVSVSLQTLTSIYFHRRQDIVVRLKFLFDFLV